MAMQLPSDVWTKNLYSGNLYLPGTSQYADARVAEEREYNAMVERLNPAPTTLRTTLAKPTLSPGPLPHSSYTESTGVEVLGGTTTGLPKYDMGKVESLAQRAAAPGVRSLRSAMQETQQGYYANPNVKRMTLRDALAGYGQGLENVMGGAYKTGAAIYGQEYGVQAQGAMQQRQIASQEAMQRKQIAAAESTQAASIASNEKLAQYQNEWQAYLASLG